MQHREQSYSDSFFDNDPMQRFSLRTASPHLMSSRLASMGNDPWLPLHSGLAAKGHLDDRRLSPGFVAKGSIGDDRLSSYLQGDGSSCDRMSRSLGSARSPPMVFHDRTPSLLFHPVGNHFCSMQGDQQHQAPHSKPIPISISSVWADISPDSSSRAPTETTMMLRGVPNTYSRDMMLEEFTRHGLLQDIDFFYLPFFPRAQRNVGYCFVNLTSLDAVARFRATFNGLKLTKVQSEKMCEVKVGKVQGLEKNIETYQNTAVMQLAEKHQPIVLRGGLQIPFPPSTISQDQ